MPLRPHLRALSHRRRLAFAASGTVVALAVLAGVLLVAPWSEEGGSADCRAAPRSARTLAENPARAAAELDPGDGGSRTGSLRQLLRTYGAPLCGGPEGTDIAGRALVAAATGRTADEQNKPALPHGKRSARVVHGIVRVLGNTAESMGAEGRFPASLAPHVAQALAPYLADVQRDLLSGGSSEWKKAAVSTEEARYSDGSGNGAAPFPRPGEYHALFGETSTSSEEPRLTAVLHRLTVSPRAYAILYDAERARLASYLERLSDAAAEPEDKPRNAREKREAEKLKARRKKSEFKEHPEDRTSGTEKELSNFSRLVATLARARTVQVANGAVTDLAAYDRAVLRHTKGLYRAAPRKAGGTPPPRGALGQRRPSAPAGKGKRAAEHLMDGKVQLFATYDAWVRDRDIPRGTAERLRTEMDTRYAVALRTP